MQGLTCLNAWGAKSTMCVYKNRTTILCGYKLHNSFTNTIKITSHVQIFMENILKLTE